MRNATRPFRQAFSHKFPIPVPEDDAGEQVYVNRVHRVCIQWIGSMYAQNPTLRFRAPFKQTGITRKEIAKQEAILNGELDSIGLDAVLKRNLQTAFLDGWSVGKSGFHAITERTAEETMEAVTDANTENYNFELPQELWPTGVLIDEDHEGHIEKHRAAQNQAKMKFEAMQKQVQQIQQQGAKDGIEVPTDPVIENELIRLHTMAQGIAAHLELHEKMREKRDREGLNATNIRVVAENCWYDYVHNSNFIWDQNATGTHDWRWVAERIIRPIDEMKAMKDWKGTPFFKRQDDLRADWSGPRPGSAGEQQELDRSGEGVASKSLDHPGHDGLGNDDYDPDRLGAIWKVWDIEHRRIIYIQEDATKEQTIEAWPHTYMKTAPHRMLYFELEEDEFKPLSPIKHFWDQQLEINRYRTKAGTIARRLSRQALADPRVPEDVISDIIAGKDGAISKLTSMGVAVDKAFHVLDWGNVPPDIHQLAAIAENDIQESTGLGEVHLGGGIKAETASAANIQKASSDIPLDLKLASIELFVKEIAGDQRGLMRQYYQQERFSEFLWEGEKVPIDWNGADLADLDASVEFGTSRKQEKEVERMQRKEAVELGAAIPGVDIAKLYAWYLQSFDLVDPQEFFLDQASQQPQQAQPGIGAGQGQNQQQSPANAGQAMQSTQDVTK